jgi:hypothetical protein
LSYHLQFFRQWLRDIGVDDIEVDDTLDHAKALAQVTLEALARQRTARFRPRTAYVIDADTRERLAAYRLTNDGPVELLPDAKPATSVSTPFRLRVVQDASALKG